MRVARCLRTLGGGGIVLCVVVAVGIERGSEPFCRSVFEARHVEGGVLSVRHTLRGVEEDAMAVAGGVEAHVPALL